ncbi:MAG TPA: S-layer homology domain-containing protein, partial [Anaerolineales bacterium]
LPAEPDSNLFLLSLSFYYRPSSSFNNANGVPSIVQGLEFTMNKWQSGRRYEWALQWENVDPSPGAGAPEWRYWDPAPPDPFKWVDTGLAGGVSGMTWHTLVLEGGIFGAEVHYRRFILDNMIIPLDKVVTPAAAPGEPDKLAVAVQLDGNYQADPYELFIDDVTLITAESFDDVPFRYWAFDWIQRLYAANITGGCGVAPLRYCPEDTITRAQMAVFLERGIHGANYNPPAVGSSTGFGDVPPTHWAAAWIKQLATDGITGGCGSGNYCPESPVTRAQMAVFLLRSKYGWNYSPPGVGSSTGFSDVPPGHWAAAWIKQLVAEGITSGCETGTYCPEAPVTRAQMAVFLVKTFSLP